MPDNKTSVCITGASGMIGGHIFCKLRDMGYHAKVLTRHSNFFDSSAEVITGDICDLNTVKLFLENSEFVFHCAGELNVQSKMWAVNVKGTENLINVASQNPVKYFCYLSSAGVTGKYSGKLVDENTPCNPMNQYEKSKYAAEKIVANGIPGCSTVILRPTNVIDEYRVGALEYPVRNSLFDMVKVFVKGGEHAHIIHASDVADAAIFLMFKKFHRTNCFIVSCDEDKFNTYGELWSLYKNINRTKSCETVKSVFHLPEIVTYSFRRIFRGHCNRGIIRYSMAKLKSEGFTPSLGVVGAVKKVFNFKRYQQQ